MQIELNVAKARWHAHTQFEPAELHPDTVKEQSIDDLSAEEGEEIDRDGYTQTGYRHSGVEKAYPRTLNREFTGLEDGDGNGSYTMMPT